MFARIFAVFVIFATFESGQGASCNVNCDPPFAEISFWALQDKTAVCNTYEKCGMDAMDVCKQNNDTAVFVSAFEAAMKVLVNFCRNPDIADLKGADQPECDVDKPQKCLMKIDQSPNDTVRCMAVGETLDCLDDFTSACKAKLLQKFVDSTSPTFETIKKECKKKGLSVGDAGSMIQPGVFTLLIAVGLTIFFHVLGSSHDM